LGKGSQGGRLTEREWKCLMAFFQKEKSLMFVWFGIFFILAAAIYVASVLEIDAQSRLIYVLYRVFIVCLAGMACCILRIMSLCLAVWRVQLGKFTVFHTAQYRHCMNKTRKELEGHGYYVLHVMWYRYAFRVGG